MNKVLYIFDRFPLSVCTQEGQLSELEELIPAQIEEDCTGLVSFLPYVDPSKIYLDQHNSSIGETWKGHNTSFAQHLLKTGETSFVDVGGGSGNIFKSVVELDSNVSWKIIDLNPTTEDPRVDVIAGPFRPEYINDGDTVVTSHFLEHLTNPKDFLTTLWDRKAKYHIFSIPNFKKYAESNYSATIMFEHPHYLVEDYVQQILAITGWKIINKEYYKEHSIFFTTERVEPVSVGINVSNSEDIINFLSYMQDKAQQLSKLDRPFYVFGAHFTYYYLLNMGIAENQIIAVVDNDSKKQGRRMYGTNTKVISPKDLPENTDIFVEMGPYNNEIKKTLLNVNFL